METTYPVRTIESGLCRKKQLDAVKARDLKTWIFRLCAIEIYLMDIGKDRYE